MKIVKCPHCGSREIGAKDGKAHAVQYHCGKCNKVFCKEYK